MSLIRGGLLTEMAMGMRKKRLLRFYGITFGWVGIGVIVGKPRDSQESR